METCYWNLQGVVEDERLAKATLGCTQIMAIKQWDHKTHHLNNIVGKGWLFFLGIEQQAKHWFKKQEDRPHPVKFAHY
jgi:hypothetical protein